MRSKTSIYVDTDIWDRFQQWRKKETDLDLEEILEYLMLQKMERRLSFWDLKKRREGRE